MSFIVSDEGETKLPKEELQSGEELDVRQKKIDNRSQTVLGLISDDQWTFF